MYEWHGYGGGMMWLFWVLLIVIILWIVIAMTKRNGNSYPTEKDRTALDIIKERYSKGEIDRDEFLQKRKDLED